MAKKNVKQKGMGFAIFMVVYAVLGIAGICFGLKWFWGFMTSYEASRPHVAIDAYMATVTRERIVEDCDVVIEKADFNIQSEEECLQYLMDAVQGEITYARKASASTDTVQTFVIRSGDQVIGSFTIEALQNVPDGMGQGVYYWEPEVGKDFVPDQYPLGAAVKVGEKTIRFTKAMTAYKKYNV